MRSGALFTPREKTCLLGKKRKYTLTEKALAANRRNLEKARLVDKAIRYRHTERREAAARVALTHACEAKRLQHAAGIDPNIRHGHTVADPQQGLVMLGRQREEYETLRELWRQSFQASNKRQAKVVEALGQAAWRRLRLQLYRAQAIDETLLFKARLALGPRVMGEAIARLGSEPGNEVMREETKRVEGGAGGIGGGDLQLGPGIRAAAGAGGQAGGAPAPPLLGRAAAE